MYYCEFAKDKYSRHGTMILAEKALSSGTGYSSIYQFTKEDAKEIMSRGHSRGLKEYPVFAEWLWIDIDDEDLDKAKERFDALVEKFEKYQKVGYFSGKKGYHLGVKTTEMFGTHVPYSHKKWIRDNDIDADESLYQHGRLFRNPGATHESTGNRKELLLQTEGDILEIPLVVEPQKAPPAIFSEGYSSADIFRDNLIRALTLVENPPRQGMRHTRLWGLACDMRESGASFTLALEMALYINGTFPIPKEDTEVQNAVEQAYSGEAFLCT